MAGIERNVIYYQGSGTAGDAENVMEIAANSYYTNVILSTLHMDETTGALSLGGTSIGDVVPDYWNAVGACQQNNKTVSMLLGGADDGSFVYVSNNPQSAANELADLVLGPDPSNPNLQLDGIDLDWESSPAYNAQVMSNFTQMLAQAIPGKLVTHCPVPENLYTYTSNVWSDTLQYLSWLNVQWYGYNGQYLLEAYSDFVNGQTSGMAIPAGKVVAGQLIGDVQLCSYIKTLVKIPDQENCGDWGGVAGWDFTATTGGNGNWAACINAALNGEDTCEGCS